MISFTIDIYIKVLAFSTFQSLRKICTPRRRNLVKQQLVLEGGQNKNMGFLGLYCRNWFIMLLTDLFNFALG